MLRNLCEKLRFSVIYGLFSLLFLHLFYMAHADKNDVIGRLFLRTVTSRNHVSCIIGDVIYVNKTFPGNMHVFLKHSESNLDIKIESPLLLLYMILLSELINLCIPFLVH